MPVITRRISELMVVYNFITPEITWKQCLTIVQMDVID